MWNLISVIGIIVTIEILLRLAGFLLQTPSDRRNQPQAEDAHVLRILALGESTTADYFSPTEGGAWPRRLEHELRQAGIPARVYNLGLGGTTTALILSHLSEYLERYHPQIVISMMGINDNQIIKFDGSFDSRRALFFSNLRLVKVTRWFIDGMREYFRCKLDYTPLDHKKWTELHDFAKPQVALLSPAQMAERIRQRAPAISDRELALLLLSLGLEPSASSSTAMNWSRASVYGDFAYRLAPRHHDVVRWELDDLLSQNTARAFQRGISISHELLKCGDNLSDDVLTRIVQFAEKDPTLGEASVFRARGLSVRIMPSLPTRYHYHFLHEQLQRAGIHLIAMQYPTLSVEALKAYFQDEKGQLETGADDIHFVSNQQNFLEALRAKKYDEVFIDRFRGTWGHTTAFGHQLIAESALKAVREVIEKNHLAK